MQYEPERRLKEPIVADGDDILLAAMAIADGTDTDWPGLEESARGAPKQAQIRELKRLQEIARQYEAWQSIAALPGFRPTSTSPFEAEGAASYPPFEIIELSASGSFGEVYRARDRELDRDFALKMLRRPLGAGGDWSRIALREGRLLARVRHPNVVTVHWAAAVGDDVVLAMEFVRGRTLAEIVTEDGPLGAREAALVGIDLAGALAAIHASGLLHRDLKAQNVMREEGGRILLMDFGLGAELAGPGQEPARAGTVSSPAGTPAYLPPEVLRGEPASPQSDLYCLGVLLYHLVTGKFPVEGESIEALRESHAEGRRTLLRDRRPDLPAPFLAVVEHAMAPKLADRFASAGELEQALSAAVGLTAVPPPATTTTSAQSTETAAPALPRTSPKLRSTVGWALLATALGLVWFLGRNADIFGGRSFTVEATLWKEGGGRIERLEPGDRVATGDGLFLEFHASRPVHLYVINQDDQGQIFLLFPLPGLDIQNPLPAGMAHRLPRGRGGKELLWGVSSPGGREHVLLAASPRPLPDLERQLASLPRPTGENAETPIALPDRARSPLRGIGRLIPANERPAGLADEGASTDVFTLARQLTGGREAAEQVWVRQIVIENPFPEHTLPENSRP